MSKRVINLYPSVTCKVLRMQIHVRIQIAIVLSCMCQKKKESKTTEERKMPNIELPIYSYMGLYFKELVTSLLGDLTAPHLHFLKLYNNVPLCPPVWQ